MQSTQEVHPDAFNPYALIVPPRIAPTSPGCKLFEVADVLERIMQREEEVASG